MWWQLLVIVIVVMFRNKKLFAWKSFLPIVYSYWYLILCNYWLATVQGSYSRLYLFKRWWLFIWSLTIIFYLASIMFQFNNPLFTRCYRNFYSIIHILNMHNQLPKNRNLIWYRHFINSFDYQQKLMKHKETIDITIIDENRLNNITIDIR